MIDLLQFSNILPVFFVAIFFAILFLQSGLEKLLDFNGNLKYLNTHFSNSIFKNNIKFLLFTLTLLECLSGLLFLIGLVSILFFNIEIVMSIMFLALVIANITICCLFLGQRVAKEYAGAANLAGYFLVAFLSFLFF